MASRYLRFRLDIEWPPIIKDPGRTMRRLMRRALMAGLEHWRDVYLPLHFKTTAYWRYGKSGQKTLHPEASETSAQLYKRRKSGLFATKMSGERNVTPEKMEADPRPIHFTGRTERMAMRTARGESERKWPGTTSTSTSARMKLVVPSYVKAHQQNRAANPGFAVAMPHYPMIDEITVVNTQEAKKIQGKVGEKLSELLAKHESMPDYSP